MASEADLNILAQDFRAFRAARRTPLEHIPPELWQRACALSRIFSPTRVAKSCQLSVSQLQKRLRKEAASNAQLVRIAPVKIAAGLIGSPSTRITVRHGLGEMAIETSDARAVSAAVEAFINGFR